MMSHRLRIILFIVAIVLLGLGIYMLVSPKPESMQKTTQITPTTTQDGDDSKLVLGSFEGTLPCADCEGIETFLTLYQDPSTMGATTYALKQRYLGRDVEPLVETGTWDYLRGDATDPDATVYGLNLDKPKAEQIYYLKVGENEVQLLDSSMNKIQSPLNFTLKKQ